MNAISWILMGLTAGFGLATAIILFLCGLILFAVSHGLSLLLFVPAFILCGLIIEVCDRIVDYFG